jgi:hypothetical protein
MNTTSKTQTPHSTNKPVLPEQYEDLIKISLLNVNATPMYHVHSLLPPIRFLDTQIYCLVKSIKILNYVYLTELVYV